MALDPGSFIVRAIKAGGVSEEEEDLLNLMALVVFIAILWKFLK